MKKAFKDSWGNELWLNIHNPMQYKILGSKSQIMYELNRDAVFDPNESIKESAWALVQIVELGEEITED